ncbi:Signal peptidase I [Acidobacteriia bacterium SbA2]|nr:Signal peptidase I [Acidobacteriia bacterium SbA2]
MIEVYQKSSLRDTFESLVVTVILAVFGTTFVVQAFKIPTGSMENTLLIGDHLLVNKFAFAYHGSTLARFLPYRDVHHGDVLVFKFPGPAGEQSEPGEHYVKRVIGLPGDRIRIFHRQVFVNGQPLTEPYVYHAWPDMERSGDDFPPPGSEYLEGSTALWTADMPNHIDKEGELVVPPGHYFAMGDNREQSWDSRFWGFVPRELISGRPLLIYWSYETPRDEYMHTSGSDWIAQTFSIIFHFPTRTRWRRTLKTVR